MRRHRTTIATGRLRAVLLGNVFAATLLCAAPASAQSTSGAAPSDNAMVNLVRLLVDQGIIKADKGAALLAQAQAEAAQARAAAPPAAPQVADLPPPPAGTLRVPYVPETVRAQIKDELREEVLAQAKAEGWATPHQAAPDWVSNLRFHGDLRIRSQTQLYARDNSTAVLDVAEFNATGPYSLTGSFLVPTINTTRNRYNLVQLRARLGVEATIADRFQLGVQLASGDDPSPISTNAMLGGGFHKRDVWLQLAYLKGKVLPYTTLTAGRMENPFRSTDLLFDPDLAFDGVAAQVDIGKVLGDRFTLAVRGGAFPLDFGDVDYPSTAFAKRNFRDRYLLSAQIEAGATFAGGVTANLAAAYHDFTYMRGHVSLPCDTYSNPAIICSTDALRPISPTKGNTYFFLRNIDSSLNPDPANPIEPQFLGLKFAYRIVNLTGSVSVPVADGITAQLTGDYVRNIGFDPRNICREGIGGRPLNNVLQTDPANAEQTPCDATKPARFQGGNQGYGVTLALGHADVLKRGEWSLYGGYKYLESDAVLDSFTDSDFHLGGTNAKGYFVGGSYGLYDRVKIGARWLSANQIVDQPLAIDVLQVDLQAAF